jgi:hypothetical protein
MKVPGANHVQRSTSLAPKGGHHIAAVAESVPDVTQDEFQPGAIEDRQAQAVVLLNDPSPLEHASKGLLATAWESLQSVTRNLVGQFLHGPIPTPVPAEEARHIGLQESEGLILEFGESNDKKLQARLGKAVEMAKEALPDAPYSGKMAVLDTEFERGTASPDGSIMVSRGLMEKLSDEELLYVVGHEMGHLEKKHDAQRLAFEQRLATAKSAGQHAYFAQRMMEFYHDAEDEADDLGLRVLQHHGIEKKHAVSFHIRRMEGLQGGDPASETHPSDAARAYRTLTT